MKKRMSVNVDAEVVAEVQKLARRECRSVSSMVSMLLSRGVYTPKREELRKAS
jgi:predicted transcriptional regulator